MSTPNPMPPSQAPGPRPPFTQQHASYRSDYGMQNGRPSPSPFNIQSPQMQSYSSPSPQQYSPQQYSQPPASKRPRLSPDIQSPFPSSGFPQTPQAGSPVGGFSVNGTISAPAPSRPGLMAPPQRPADKNEDRNYDDILAGTGINIEEEARNLTQPNFYTAPTPPGSFQARSGSFDYSGNSFGRPGSSDASYSLHQLDGQGQDHGQFSAEERKQREEARADWEASRHTQHALWDMFLLGGNLNDKIRKISLNEHLVDPQSGVMVNTQRQGPPPSARVNGFEGATRVINKGQAILDTGAKGERLSEVMKLVCLATKARLTGLLSASSRLAIERRQHSKGNIPTEWSDIAVSNTKPATDGPESERSPGGSTSMKRTHSQANSELTAQNETLTGPNRVTSTLLRIAQAERAEEEARRAKRQRRKAAASGEASSIPSNPDAVAEAALAAALDPEKKTTKKERKLAESKFSEQQQHKSANEAARLAVSGLMGSRFGKQRTYDWMNKGGAGGGSPALTPGRPLASTNTSTAATPVPERARIQPKEKQIGQWDEDKDPGVQARDVLLVLESDGRTPRTYVRGYSMLDI